MLLSLFTSLYATTNHRAVDQSIEKWYEEFAAAPRIVPRKNALQCFVPATIDGSRSNENVRGITALVYDFDDVSQFDMYQLSRAIRNYRYLFYTTYKHGKDRDLWRARVVFEIDRKIKPADHKRLLSRFAKRQGFYPLIDEQATDISRAFFYPGTTVQRSDQAILHLHNPPEAAKVAVAPLLEKGVVKTLPLKTRLEAFVKTLNTSNSAKSRKAATHITRLMNGKPLAPMGSRDDALWYTTSTLANHLPDATPDDLLPAFRLSIMAHQSEPEPPSMEDAYEKLIRACEGRMAMAKSSEESTSDEPSFETLLKRAGRVSTYSDDELNALMDTAGVTNTEDLRSKWMLQKGKAFWILTLDSETKKGDYVRRHHFDVSTAMLPMLAPAQSAGVDMVMRTKNAYRWMVQSEVMRRFGTVIDSSEYSLDTRTTRLEDGQLKVAVAKQANIFPKYHPHVNEWLTYLGGAYSEKLLDWLSFFLCLSRPCAALYLHSLAGVGKSLLIYGLAKLWVYGQPIRAIQAFRNFNSEITQTPFIAADETFPTANGRPMTEEFRDILQRRNHPVEFKGLEPVPATGAVRMVIAANNPAIIRPTAQETHDAFIALDERIFAIKPDVAARKFLESLTEDQRYEMANYEIAEHVRWLYENRKAAPQGRFMVTGGDPIMTRMMVSTGLRTHIFHWVANWLSREAPKMHRAPVIVEKTDEEYTVMVSAENLAIQWTDKGPPNLPRSPSLSEIQYSLSGITDQETQRHGQIYQVLSADMLKVWCDTVKIQIPWNLHQPQTNVINASFGGLRPSS